MMPGGPFTAAGERPCVPGVGEWLTREQLAASFLVRVDTLARWASERRGPPYVRVGALALYHIADVHEWMLTRVRTPEQ